MVEPSQTSGRLLATIPWAPAGPLPRRFQPVRISSIAAPGPPLLRTAPTRLRTLADGAVCLLSAPDEESGRCAALRLDAGGLRDPVGVGPDPDVPGWRILDFVGAADGLWTVLELIPGPPDRAQARRIDAHGATIWSTSAIAGSPESLRQLLADPDSVLAVTEGPPRRLVAVDAEGAVTDVQSLDGADGACFANGRGQLGFVGFDPSSEMRTWVTIDIDSGTRHSLALAPENASALDVPLGMDALGRPYGNLAGAVVRIDADGRVEWSFALGNVVVASGEVWIGRPAESGRGITVTPLTAAAQATTTLDPAPAEGARRWRLAGRSEPDAFVLHGFSDSATPGELATVAADGSLIDRTPAPTDVWLEGFDLQNPLGPAVTDAGEVDLATRGPGGLHLIRVMST